MDLTEKEMIEVMLALDCGDNPKVGIFWYLPEEHDLFEVHSICPPNEQEPYTIPDLHKDVWRKAKFRAKARGKKDSIYYY